LQRTSPAMHLLCRSSSSSSNYLTAGLLGWALLSSGFGPSSRLAWPVPFPLPPLALSFFLFLPPSPALSVPLRCFAVLCSALLRRRLSLIALVACWSRSNLPLAQPCFRSSSPIFVSHRGSLPPPSTLPRASSRSRTQRRTLFFAQRRRRLPFPLPPVAPDFSPFGSLTPVY